MSFEEVICALDLRGKKILMPCRGERGFYSERGGIRVTKDN